MHPQRKTIGKGIRDRGDAGRQASEDRALIAGSMWLYLGFMGAAAFGAGLSLTLDSATSGALTAAVIVGGGMLAPACWWKARAIFDRASEQSVGGSDATIPAPSNVVPVERNVRERVGRAWTDVVAGRRPLQQR